MALKYYLNGIEGPNDYNYGVLKIFHIKKKIIIFTCRGDKMRWNGRRRQVICNRRTLWGLCGALSNTYKVTSPSVLSTTAILSGAPCLVSVLNEKNGRRDIKRAVVQWRVSKADSVPGDGCKTGIWGPCVQIQLFLCLLFRHWIWCGGSEGQWATGWEISYMLQGASFLLQSFWRLILCFLPCSWAKLLMYKWLIVVLRGSIICFRILLKEEGGS